MAVLSGLRLASRRIRPLRLTLALVVLFGILYFAVVPSLLVASLGTRPRAFVHPIDSFLADAQQQWAAKVGSQSKTLKQAANEYTRRYGRPPFKGFGDWYEAAVEVDFKLIDEFDTIDEDLALFRRLSSSELRRRTRQALRSDFAFGVAIKDGEVNIIEDTDGGGVTRGDLARPRGFAEMIRPYASKLPDMEFAINALAESIVLPPWERKQALNMSLYIEDLSAYITPRNGFASWYHFTNTCHPTSFVRQRPELYQWPLASGILPPRTGVNSAEVEGDLDLDAVLRMEPNSFQPHTDAFQDFCHVSPDRFYEYGQFYSGIHTFSEVVPVFSPGKMPGSIDIRIPSGFYKKIFSAAYSYGYDKEQGTLDLENPADPPWEKKNDRIYWRGADGSGGNSPAGRFAYHSRHRLVQIASQYSDLVVPFVRRAGQAVEIILASVDELRTSALDFAFILLHQCGSFPGKCEQKALDYFTTKKTPLNDMFASKLIFDTDGMGYSGRFLALLTSRSAVLKSTIYREFFDDWLQPWVHFVPISMHFGEIFNVRDYFLNDSIGKQAIQKMAIDSREHKLSQLRQEDLELYVYRLCLEWARLWHQDIEENMDFV